MNSVILIGRLTRDPDVRYTDSGLAIARYSLAIDRNTKEKITDYPNIVSLGKTAEVIEKYTSKGSQVAVQGKIQTGSYEKNGSKVYYTEVLAERVKLLGSKDKSEKEDTPDGFEYVDDELPF